jgi:hypothetical protein
MHVSLVVWDDENEAKIRALGSTVQEIEDVMYNRRNETVLSSEGFGSLKHSITYVITKTNKNIAVTCTPVCGNPLEVYPIAVHEVQG